MKKKTGLLIYPFVAMGMLLVVAGGCVKECPQTIESVLFYPVNKDAIDNTQTSWVKTNYLSRDISFVMELEMSGGVDMCTPYTTNEINEESIRIFCNKTLNQNGISIPPYVNIIEKFETTKSEGLMIDYSYYNGYLFTLKADYRSIFQNESYTLIVEAKSSISELFTDSCIVSINENKIIFNPNLIYGSVSDIDNNTYKTIVIGTQTWMAENLKTTRYANNELLGTTTPSTLDISGENNPKYQWASGSEESNVEIYGRLYTWYTVTDSRNLCPTGWHIPSKAEWDRLLTYLGGEGVAGNKLKEAGAIHWRLFSGATNNSGFTAIPGGRREPSGSFEWQGAAFWWTSSVYNERFSFDFIIWPEPSGGTVDSWSSGHSIRCVKD